MATVEQHDILLVGAGLTGINTAHVLKTELPHRKLTIVEARPTLGGTWSFFKYPGFRSDSNMSTFGFQWYPWTQEDKIATGADILNYITEAARTDGTLDKNSV